MILLCFHPHQSDYRTSWMSSIKSPTGWACLLTLKTKIVVFRNGVYLARGERWYYGSELVSVASSYKYLGLKFTTKVCLNRISEDSDVRAKQGTVEIFKVSWNIGCFDINVFFKLFDAQIVPVLLYGSELWGCFGCPNVEKVHMYACKRIIGLSSQSPNHMVYGELGRHHLSVLASTRCVKYWLRLNKLTSNRYARMAYNLLKSMAEEGKEIWASVVLRLTVHEWFRLCLVEWISGRRNTFLDWIPAAS